MLALERDSQPVLSSTCGGAVYPFTALERQRRHRIPGRHSSSRRQWQHRSCGLVAGRNHLVPPFSRCGGTWTQAAPLTDSEKAQYPCSLELAGTGLHIFWVDDRNGGWELYYRRSANAGSTWEKEVRLTPGIDMFRFGTAICGINVQIVWGSRSRLEKVPVDHSSWTWTWGDIYHPGSVDGGQRWGTPVRLTGSRARPSVLLLPLWAVLST